MLTACAPTSSDDAPESSTSGASASVDATGATDGGPPRCSSNSDCIQGYVCNTKQNRCTRSCYRNSDCPGDRICRKQMCRPSRTTCNDVDGDGYGSSTSPDLSTCPACQNGKANGCKPDCRDSNPRIHPGALDTCDGADNDCDGTTDEPVTCSGAGSCPASLNPPTDRNGTRIGCKTVDRSGKTQRECVLVGKFTRNNCNIDKNKATCQNGQWGELPSGCTNSN